MPTWSIEEVASAVSGHVIRGDAVRQIEGIHFDSRKIKENDLFVPLQAERDGHDFVPQAFAAGAVCSFWQEDKDISAAPKEMALILVEDPQQALEDFARFHLNLVDPHVIGITGSNGKTTTKDLTASILSEKYQVYKTQGNFNNHIGVPKTILDMPIDTDILVLEMGMDRPGEIDHLSRMVEPELAVVTMIGESHIEYLGSRANIAAAKLEILNGLQDNGLFICPVDEPLLTESVPKNQRTIYFGLDSKTDGYAENIEAEVFSTSFNTNIYPGEQFTLPVPGVHNVKNALVAMLIAKRFDVDAEQVRQGLLDLELTKSRLEWIEADSGIWILNDAYNASPSSMKASLDYFQKADIPGRKIAVLGDILELGSFSEEMHRSIGEVIDAKSLDAVYLYGSQMKSLHDYLIEEELGLAAYYYGDNLEELKSAVQSDLKREDHLLIKSSFGTGLRLLVDDLLAVELDND